MIIKKAIREEQNIYSGMYIKNTVST